MSKLEQLNIIVAEGEMRKVLMIAYAFPPMGGSGVQRSLKFAKYLADFGWQPIIVTVSNPPGPELDYSLLEEVPAAARVYRAPNPRWARFLSRTARGPTIEAGDYQRSPGDSKRGYAKSWIRALVDIPDPQIQWFPFALAQATRALIRHRVSLIYTTSDPFTDHLSGYVLKRLSGKPWVADFRDPWTMYARYYQPYAWRRWIDRRMETLFLRYADRVLVTCGRLIDELCRVYPSLDPAKFLEITNGYDAADFDFTHPSEGDAERLVITFAGRFHNRHNFALGFLKALRRVTSGPLGPDGVLFRVIGTAGPQVEALIKDWRLDGAVELLGYLPHRECTTQIVRSDVLLLNINEGRGHDLIFPAKLFEYLAAGKPILASVIEGATADLIRELGAGIVVPPEHVAKICEAIETLYQAKARGRLRDYAIKSVGEAFQRRRLTASLAASFDQVVRDSRSRRASPVH